MRKGLAILVLACASAAVAAKTDNMKVNNKMNQNPLLTPSTLPFGVPDFSKIKSEHYLPAIQEGIRQQRQEIAKIVDNKAKPTFANTSLAYEHCGRLLDRVSNVFFCVTEADGTPEIEAAEKQVIPLLTDLQNEITFNQRLFERVKYVYDHERSGLKGEDLKLLDEIYKQFVR